MIRRLITRIRLLVADDLREELELHRELTEREFRRAGLDADDAARAATRRLGNPTLAREDARAVWLAPWIESVWQDVRYAARTIRRHPGFALSVAVVMALGIGATTAVFSLVDALLLRDLPVVRPERLVYFRRPAFSYAMLTEVRARGTHIFSQLSGWNLEREHVQWGETLEPGDVLMATGDFHSTLGVHAAVGRTLTPEDDVIGGGSSGPVAVISDAVWQRRFGRDPSVVGRSVRIRQRTFTIVGVTPPGFTGVAPGLAAEITIPVRVLAEDPLLRGRTSASLHFIGRLQDGLDIQTANVALQAVWPAVLEAVTSPDEPPERRAVYLSRTTSLESARAGYSRVRNQFARPLWVLLALTALLLTVATASAANLLLARGAARGRELAVRIAIGAGRARVIRQLLTESIVWTALGAVGGVFVARWTSQALVAMMTTRDTAIALDAGPSLRVLLFTLCTALATAALAAILPALAATRGQILNQRFFHGLARGHTVKKPLIQDLTPVVVSTQIALTVVLLFGAALFGRSLQRILAQDAGFERGRVVLAAPDAAAAGYRGARHTAFYAEFLERLRAIPGAESVSLSWYPPITGADGMWTRTVSIDRQPLQQQQSLDPIYFNAITPGYFRTMGIGLVGGRDFTTGDVPGAPRVAIVSASLARRLFPDGNVIGRFVSIGRHASRQNLEIVGVASDVKYQRLEEPVRAVAYLPSAQLPEFSAGQNLVAQIRSSAPSSVVADGIMSVLRTMDRTVPVRIQTVDDRIRDSLVTERVIALLAAVLAGTALVLACAALYGLLAYAVSRQTSEIGLRIALGAPRAGMVWLVLRRSLVLAGFGIAAGAAASLGLARYTRTLLYGIAETDPAALAVTVSVILAVAVGAAIVPARRAARMDPLNALRTD